MIEQRVLNDFRLARTWRDIMQDIQSTVVSYNTGWSFEVRQGQHIRIEGESTCDFVAFNLNDLRERFDQARTKRNQGKIFVSVGDLLLSKSNNIMFTIVEDTFTDGTHDLQKGACSHMLWEKWGPWSMQPSYWVRSGGRDPERIEDLPDHGCWENLDAALSPYGIAKEDIPSPLNIFQDMTVDTKGRLRASGIKPKPGTYVDLRAEMDCLVGISACPELGRGKEIRIMVYEE
jgi:uncharacterized protein YcgI (DUF1989 family)